MISKILILQLFRTHLARAKDEIPSVAWYNLKMLPISKMALPRLLSFCFRTNRAPTNTLYEIPKVS